LDNKKIRLSKKNRKTQRPPSRPCPSAAAPVLVPEACDILKRAVAMCAYCNITFPHRNKKIRLSKKNDSLLF
ncbi:MAG: hypothetical protein LBT53_08015, partial [Puniceicoccales bacterium]|nr:hypothetical protein [Puniceicoccales bacterium]